MMNSYGVSVRDNKDEVGQISCNEKFGGTLLARPNVVNSIVMCWRKIKLSRPKVADSAIACHNKKIITSIQPASNNKTQKSPVVRAAVRTQNKNEST